MEVIIVIAILILAVMLELPDDLSLPENYNNRKCTGKKWKTDFHDVPKQQVRQFLYLFTVAFAFSPENKLKFEPTDRVLEVYRQIYPSKFMPDVLELETLADSIEDEYGVSFAEIWHEELTLGELFQKVSSA